MSIFDAFKSRWSAGAMTREDRKKLFWYLQRRTSYTAWRREAEAFDSFAAIFEKQVREEPVAKADISCGDTEWEWFYPDVIKGQVLYEKGLERLRNGDRTVWLHNERGILEDAGVVSGHWYSELVNNGMRGDHFQDGKYLEELISSMKQFSLASRETGEIQPMMADTPAPESWSTYWEDAFAQMPLPQTLPDVPESQTETLIRTGKIAPVFGIYEPQIKDGCMNYLLGGVPAPPMWESDGTHITGRKLSVVWRLIWEDTRYLDGRIPDAEADYFPDEDSSLKVASEVRTLNDDLLSTRTGDTCPRSGEWACMDDLNVKIVLRQGERVPQNQGRENDWVWLRKV